MRAIKWSAQDSDSGLAQLLYRKTREYAASHGCSVVWSALNNEKPSILESAWIPEHIVPAISADGDESFHALAATSGQVFMPNGSIAQIKVTSFPL